METSWASLVISDCWRLMVVVRKKQITTNRPIIIRKMKLERTSNPRVCESESMGPGKIAMIKNARGSSNQATEFLMDMEFLRRLKIIIAKRMIEAIAISICNLSMFPPGG